MVGCAGFGLRVYDDLRQVVDTIEQGMSRDFSMSPKGADHKCGRDSREWLMVRFDAVERFG